MEVTYLGHAAFLLKHKDVKLVCDPFDGQVGFKLPKMEANIVTISHDHFDHNAAGLISGEPARNASQRDAGGKGHLDILDSRIKEMEARIDLLEKELPPITNFILPGGTVLGARTHIVRAICRRVERQAVALFSRQPSAVSFQQKDKNIILKYLNRLSDLFFMLARFINKEEKIEEVVWSGIRSKPS